MLIKAIDLVDCKTGDIIADDIWNDSGVTLVAKDTIVNDFIKKKLASYGIRSVKIYQEPGNINKEFQRSYTDILLQTKNVFQDIVAGKPLNSKSISKIADKIINSIQENDKIIKCLSYIQSTDEYTFRHSVNVAFYSMLIARWLQLDESKVKVAVESGLLHDVGKVRVPGEILNKKGKLTKEEFDIIKEHTILGYEIVKDMKEIESDIKSAILLHHERVDGSGYPYHYNSEHVNIYARIVAIADVFDAMTSDRVYRGKATPFDVFEMFQSIGVGIFDTHILNMFIAKLSAYLVGARVQLNSGKTGEIVFIPLQNISYPIIKVESDYIDLFTQEEVKIVGMVQAD